MTSQSSRSILGFSLLDYPDASLAPFDVMRKMGSGIARALSFRSAQVELTGSTIFELFEFQVVAQNPSVSSPVAVVDQIVIGATAASAGMANAGVSNDAVFPLDVKVSGGESHRSTGYLLATDLFARRINRSEHFRELLRMARPKLTGLGLEELRRGDLYVVTETLLAKRVEVVDDVSMLVQADGQVGARSWGVSGLLSLKRKREDSTKFAFSDGLPRTIAVKVQRIGYSGGSFHLGAEIKVRQRGSAQEETASDL